MKQNEILRQLDKEIGKLTWKSCMARIVGDEELVQKFEEQRDELNGAWLRIYNEEVMRHGC